MQQQLVEDNVNLVYSIVHTHYPTFAKDEDIIQAGMLGLCVAAENYDESKSKFSTYAYKCIRNFINKEFATRKKHRNQLSLDYEVSNDDGEPGKLVDYIACEEDINYIDMDGFYDSLTPSEKEFFDLRKSGLTVSEITEKLDCSKELVYQQLRRIKTAWRETNGD